MLRIFLCCSSTVFTEVSKSSPELADMASVTSQLAGGNLLFLCSKAGIRGRMSCLPCIYLSSVDSNSDSHTCETSFNV